MVSLALLADLRYLWPQVLDSERRGCYNAPIVSHTKRCGRGVGRKRRVSESGRWWKPRTGLRLKNTSKPKPNAAWPPVGAAWRRHVTSVGACLGPQRSKSGGTTESGLRPEIKRRSAAKNGGAFYVFHFGRVGKDRQSGDFAGVFCAHGVARAGHCLLYTSRVEAHGFKQLRALVRLQGGDAHL